MKFNLRKIKLDNGSTSYHPRVPISLFHSGKSKEVIGVLDTSSDLIYLPKSVADYFELKLSKDSFTARTTDSKFKYRSSKILIEIKKGHESLRENFTVVVSEQSTHTEIILGVPFLSCFSATFDYANKKIILKKPTKKIY